MDSRMSANPAPIARHQIQIIHMAKKELLIDEEVYRDLLQQFGGTTSSKDLSFRAASRLIDHFVDAGFMIKEKNPKRAGCRIVCRQRPKRDAIPDNVIYLASPEQLDFIDALQKLITWKFSDGFSRWFVKYFGGKEEKRQRKIIFSPTASDVIEGLKKMYFHQHGCTCPLKAPVFKPVIMLVNNGDTMKLQAVT